MFLIRTAFWLTLVILILPAEKQTDGHPGDASAQASVTAGEAFGAAQNAVSDLSSFCNRNQSTCDTGRTAARVFTEKAQYGAKLLYNMMSESGVPAPAAQPMKPQAAITPSQNTLTPSDLEPVWRGPQPNNNA